MRHAGLGVYTYSGKQSVPVYGVEAPVHARAQALLLHLRKELPARHFLCAQRSQVGRGLLAIDLRSAMLAAQCDQRRERNF
ncbi:hypothetical protein D3C81_2147950 [compost metagenome]